MDVSMLGDPPIPTRSSSPGWKAQPQDVSKIVGSYTHFSCKNSFHHDNTVWFYQGKRVDKSSPSAKRFRVYDGKKSLQFGPVKAEDHGALIMCEAMTSYGPLPSQAGRVTVFSKLTCIFCTSCNCNHTTRYVHKCE